MMRGGSYNRLHGPAPSAYFSSNGPSYYIPSTISSNGTNNANSQPPAKSRYLQYFFMLVVLFVVLVTVVYRSSSSGVSEFPDDPALLATGSSSFRHKKLISAVTWNIAAINNNPFEYWITSQDPSYNALMSNVSHLVVSPPADFDAPISSVFTEQMLSELVELLQDAKLLDSSNSNNGSNGAEGGFRGVATSSLPAANDLISYFRTQYAPKRIISEFLKDGVLGKKRLVSMPDRVTNTISSADGSSALRPTVINCFRGADLTTLNAWWKEWKFFFFQQDVFAKKSSKSPSATPQKVKIFKMIQKIEKAKYPSISADEEKMSIPLSILSLAIFDAILVHTMNHITNAYGASMDWQRMRQTMCTSLNQQKTTRVLSILDSTYAKSDMIFLQEVAGNFAAVTKDKAISNLFDIYQSSLMDTERDQNSFILLKKGAYRDVVEVTADVNAILAEQSAATKSKVPVVAGDLIVLLAADARSKSKYILASFHGDTNGLATKPVLNAVHAYATAHQPASKLLFGMDANTYAHPESDQQGVVDFAAFYRSKKLNSCYGPNPNPLNFTTFHARTHLQPQLNKAITLEEKDLKGDKNPKDFIVFFDADFAVLQTTKDNTGERKYVENMVFPTLSFPSDHGITSTLLEEVVQGK